MRKRFFRAASVCFDCQHTSNWCIWILSHTYWVHV